MTFNRSVNGRREQIGVVLCYSLDPIRNQTPVASAMPFIFVMLYVVDVCIVCSRFISTKIVYLKAMHIPFQVAHAPHYPGTASTPWRKCFHTERNGNAFVK